MADWTVRIWNIEEDQPSFTQDDRNVLVLRGHINQVLAVNWAHDGRRLLSAGDDGAIVVWDATAGPAPLIQRTATSPDGRLALSIQGKLIEVRPLPATTSK